MKKRRLDNVSKEALYYAVLCMIRQDYSKFVDGYMWHMCISAYERADEIANEVFDWSSENIDELEAEIERMEKILVERGETRWL